MAIDAGQYGCLALRADGTVTSWGDLYDIGLPPMGLRNVIAISMAGAHALALRSDGTVVAWGNTNGTWWNVPSNVSNIVAVSAGCGISLALRNNGTVAAWGYEPLVRGADALTNIMAISAGCGTFCLAMQSNGQVLAWGDNSSGQCNVPLGLNATAISAGYQFGLALRANGTVAGWGQNSDGQCNVPADLANVIAVSASLTGYHSLALRADGKVIAWGFNNRRQLNIPTNMPPASAISAGALFSMAMIGGGSQPVTNLRLDMVPALTPFGIVGATYRLEYRTNFDPTNVWYPLWSFIMTNSQQPLIDLSAMGHPYRFYRLVLVP